MKVIGHCGAAGLVMSNLQKEKDNCYILKDKTIKLQ